MKNLRYFVFIFLLIPIFFSCQSTKLTANLLSEVDFKSNEDDLIFKSSIFKAEFYSLNDKSLYFVKLTQLDDDLTFSDDFVANSENLLAESKENFVAENDDLNLSNEKETLLRETFAQKTLTLTRAISASGERYVDETGKIEFWLKGNEATLTFYFDDESEILVKLRMC